MNAPATLPPTQDGEDPAILLIDASGILHRQYHGAPSMLGHIPDAVRRIPRPLDVGALRGYLDHVNALLARTQFNRVIHVLDGEYSLHRCGIDAQYKANRSRSDPALAAQIHGLPLLLQALGVRSLQHRGVEADDLIASLARAYATRGAYVCVYSADKDLLCLVKDGEVTVASPGKRQGADGRQHHEVMWYEEADVRAVWGVDPWQVQDLLALAGDSVDNIRGVEGIGAKGAAALLGAAGTLEAALHEAEALTHHADAAVRKAAKRLLAPGAMDAARHARRLTGLLDQVPLALAEPEAADPVPDGDVLPDWTKALQAPPDAWPEMLSPSRLPTVPASTGTATHAHP